MSDRLLRANETLLLIPAYVSASGEVTAIYGGGTAPISAMTKAALDYWIPVNTANHANANGGGNISCAVRDDMTLGLTDSNADTDRTLCDEGQTEQLTTKQFDAAMTGFRDKVLAADGAYNLFNKLTFAPDVPYIVAHRIGVKNNALASVNEMWDFYFVNTDVQVQNYANNANITVTQTFIPKQVVNFAYELAA